VPVKDTHRRGPSTFRLRVLERADPGVEPTRDPAASGGDPGRPELKIELVDDRRRRPGRPRKWESNAERMRAYRARQRQVAARMVDPAIAPEAAAEKHRLRERVDELEAERDRLWGQVERLQDRIRHPERGDTSDANAAADVPRGLTRAERRRLTRELARRQRRRAAGDS
jgi:hypothetical protein